MVELDKLEQDLVKCYEVVVEVATLTTTFNEINNQMDAVKMELKKLRAITESSDRSSSKAALVFVAAIPSVVIGYFSVGYVVTRMMNIWGFFGFLITSAISIAIGGVLANMIFGEKYCRDSWEKHLVKLKEHREWVEVNSQKQESFADEIWQIESSEKMAVLRSLIPDMYMNVDAVENFLALIQNKRAENLKEAINLYEDIKHKEEMMMKQNEALELQHQSLDMLANQAEMQKQQMTNFSDFQKQQIKSQQRLVTQSKKLSKQARYGNVVGTVNMVRQWNK